MSTLAINIRETSLRRMHETAAKLGIAIDDLVQKSIEEYLDRQQKVEDAAEYVLKKNEELYRRLA